MLALLAIGKVDGTWVENKPLVSRGSAESTSSYTVTVLGLKTTTSSAKPQEKGHRPLAVVALPAVLGSQPFLQVVTALAGWRRTSSLLRGNKGGEGNLNRALQVL